MEFQEGVDLVDCTTLELHQLLEKNHWRVEFPKWRARSKDLVYVQGGDLIWYLQHTASTFSHHYLWALAHSPVHGLPVEPFRKVSYYLDLISGKVDSKQSQRRKKQLKCGFDFEATVHSDLVEKPKGKPKVPRTTSTDVAAPRARYNRSKILDEPEEENSTDAESEEDDEEPTGITAEVSGSNLGSAVDEETDADNLIQKISTETGS